MARKLRLSFPGAIHHVMFRGNERHDIFRDDDDRQWFLDRLADSVESFTVRMYLVCLMSNHVHMLMETPRGNLSAFMGRLLTGYSVHFNRRHRRSGHLTQGRYRAQLVEGDNYLMRLSRYIHLNPVCTASWQKCSVQDRAAALRQYDWSTYRGYAGLAEQWPFVDEGPILAQMENLGLKDRAGYAAFVEAGLAQNDSDFSTLYAHAALSIGSPEFETNARTLHQRAAGKTKRREDVALRRHAGPLPVTFVLQKLAALLGAGVAQSDHQPLGAHPAHGQHAPALDVVGRGKGDLGRAVGGGA